jgi:hypothetical protein
MVFIAIWVACHGYSGSNGVLGLFPVMGKNTCYREVKGRITMNNLTGCEISSSIYNWYVKQFITGLNELDVWIDNPVG